MRWIEALTRYNGIHVLLFIARVVLFPTAFLRGGWGNDLTPSGEQLRPGAISSLSRLPLESVSLA